VYMRIVWVSVCTRVSVCVDGLVMCVTVDGWVCMCVCACVWIGWVIVCACVCVCG